MSKIYPAAPTLSEYAATAALDMVQAQLRNQTWSFCTREELLEAADALSARLSFLWENGGKQAFDEMIQREFGRPAA